MSEHDRDRRRVDLQDRADMQTRMLNDLRGKTIINLADGKKIGQVDDILVDPKTLRVSGLVVNRGGMLDRETRIVPASGVEKWGIDAILVRDANVFRSESELPDRESWLSSSDKLNGLSIVNTEGEKIGQIDDVLIDDRGQIVAYRVSSGGSLLGEARTREIPAQATRTLGGDVAIFEVDPRS